LKTDAARLVQHCDDIRGAFEQRAEPGLAFLKRLLDAPAFREVGQREMQSSAYFSYPITSSRLSPKRQYQRCLFACQWWRKLTRAVLSLHHTPNNVGKAMPNDLETCSEFGNYLIS
jgi:hypothetical protein